MMVLIALMPVVHIVTTVLQKIHMAKRLLIILLRNYGSVLGVEDISSSLQPDRSSEGLPSFRVVAFSSEVKMVGT
jgi:hypothetical protein